MNAATSLFAKPTVRPMPPRNEMERAFLSSDRSYDGVFFTAVKSTGIFCRPSCPARKPLPQNVEFFGTVKTALFAGYRPCKRCRPLENDASDCIAQLLSAVENSPTGRVTADELRSLGIDPARARRQFLKSFGLTFQAYCRGHRLSRALKLIRGGGSVDDAVFATGYESHSGFRDHFQKTFGHPPGQIQSASLDCVHLAWITTPVGPMVSAATDEGICLFEFTDRRMLEAEFDFLRRRFRRPFLPSEHPHHAHLRRELTEYFAGQRTQFTVPLVRMGTEFEMQVWSELLKIPHGEVRSYEDIARSIRNPQAVRAVGRANGMNRIAILIPCHRVINKSGELGGYGGGLWRKRLLLHLEKTREPLTQAL